MSSPCGRSAWWRWCCSVRATCTTTPARARGPLRRSTSATAGGGSSRVVVHVAGAVRHPGVYRLPASSRVVDAVRRAGGARRHADLAALNLAAKVEDGRQVLVPLARRRRPPPSGRTAAGGSTGAAAAPVDLNTATPEQLDQLDGVGPGDGRRRSSSTASSTAASARSTSSARCPASARSASPRCASRCGCERGRGPRPPPDAPGAEVGTGRPGADVGTGRSGADGTGRSRAAAGRARLAKALVAGCGRLASVLAAARGHPRHVVLFSLAAGLGLGPVSPAVTLGAALVAALVAGRRGLALVAAAAVLGGASLADARLAALDAGASAPCTGGSGRAARSCSSRSASAASMPRRAVRLEGLGEQAVARLRVPRGRAHGSWPAVGEVVALSGLVAPLAKVRRVPALAAARTRRSRWTRLRRTRAPARRGGRRARRDPAAGGGRPRPGLPATEAALLRGMVLGQDEQLSDEVRTDFQRSGLAHLLAVSGQNVVLLACSRWRLRDGGRHRPPRAAAGGARRWSRSTCRSRAAARRSSAPA